MGPAPLEGKAHSLQSILADNAYQPESPQPSSVPPVVPVDLAPELPVPVVVVVDDGVVEVAGSGAGAGAGSTGAGAGSATAGVVPGLDSVVAGVEEYELSVLLPAGVELPVLVVGDDDLSLPYEDDDVELSLPYEDDDDDDEAGVE